MTDPKEDALLLAGMSAIHAAFAQANVVLAADAKDRGFVGEAQEMAYINNLCLDLAARCAIRARKLAGV